ncbi:unnamed protein product [[Candida] boidinii]|nr:unnamed protein product [[Candida] boidinii]
MQNGPGGGEWKVWGAGDRPRAIIREDSGDAKASKDANDSSEAVKTVSESTVTALVHHSQIEQLHKSNRIGFVYSHIQLGQVHTKDKRH